MQKKLLITLSSFALLALASCNNPGETSAESADSSADTSLDTSVDSSTDTSSGSSSLVPSYEEGSEVAQKALASLKKVNHEVDVDMSATVYRVSESEVGIRLDYRYVYDYYYGDNGERGYGIATTRDAYDVFYQYDEDGNIVYDEDGNAQYELDHTSSTSTTPATYWKDLETGSAVSESLGVDNVVYESFLADYDDDTGIYTPYVFDSQFKNPWDYIRASDLTLDEDGVLHLDTAKADFLIDCYNGTAINWVEDCVVNLDEEGAISGLTFSIPDQTTVGLYTRVTTFEVAYSRHGEETVEHVTPLTNDNPELATALSCLDEATSYTYTRDVAIPEGTTLTTQYQTTVGYYTEDYVLYHQIYQGTERDDAQNAEFYEGGDDHDYRVLWSEEDQLYYVYEYIYGTTQWDWSIVYISGTTLYTFSDFSEIGPSFGWGNISSSVFTKVTEGDVTYYEADSSVMDTIGAYFDNQFVGVHSDYLDGGTEYCRVYLTSDGTAIDHVETGFTYSGYDYQLTYTLEDINSTSIPSWASL